VQQPGPGGDGGNRGSAERRRGQRDQVGAERGDVDRTMRKGGADIDDDEGTVPMGQFGDGSDVGHGARRRIGERHGDDPGMPRDQLLVLPRRELAGLQIDLCPAHAHTDRARRCQPGAQRVIGVEPAQHDLVAEAPVPRQRHRERLVESDQIRAEHHVTGTRADEIADRPPRLLHGVSRAFGALGSRAGLGGRRAQGGDDRADDRLGLQRTVWPV
jgi:hypothetical protein